MSGRDLYERVRRLRPDWTHWYWLEQERREFWELLAKALR